jgi:hypothetical protein
MKLLMYDTAFVVNIARKSNYLDLNDWLNWYDKDVAGMYTSDNDRSGSIIFPFKTYVPENCKIPKFVDTNITYEDACISRAKEIIKLSEQTGRKIYLLYSGGIDSSTVLTSFINLLGVRKASQKLTIMMSNESIIENPWMWEKFIRPHFNVVNSKNFDAAALDINTIYLNGELNDQLFGATNPFKLSVKLSKKFNIPLEKMTFDEEFLHKAYSTAGLSDSATSKWTSAMLKLMESCPVKDQSFITLAWWYGFTCKWINVKYRAFMFNNIASDTYTIPEVIVQNNIAFFDSTDFQLWAMNNKEPKHLGSYESFKYTAKKYVSNLVGPEYMEKLKKLSFDKVLAMKKRTIAFDSDFVLHNNVTLDDIYLQENDFNR